MKLGSYNIRGRASFGAIVGDGIVDLKPRLSRFNTLLDIFQAGALGSLEKAVSGVRPDFALSEAAFLPPLHAPEKIICVGANYASRNEELKDGAEPPKYPSVFMRTPGSLVGHGQPIIRPKASEQLDYEGEIVLVIGRQGRHIPADRALDHVAGVTLCNEGTVRDWLHHGKSSVTQGKSFDQSGSIGPWIVTEEIDLKKPLHLITRVNADIRQDDTTSNLIFSFADLIAYISTFTNLKPGDMIVTGTPTGAGARFDPPRWLKAGDVVEVEVAEIGTLRNVVAEET